MIRDQVANHCPSAVGDVRLLVDHRMSTKHGVEAILTRLGEVEASRLILGLHCLVCDLSESAETVLVGLVPDVLPFAQPLQAFAQLPVRETLLTLRQFSSQSCFQGCGF